MLSALIFWPMLGGFAIALGSQRRNRLARFLTLLVLMVELLILAVLCWRQYPTFDLQVQHLWIMDLGIHYQMRLDGVSFLLSSLTALLAFVGVVLGWHSINRWAIFGPLLLLLVGSMLGVFLSYNLLVFYIFWEVMLIPMYFMMVYWGKIEARIAATRFLLFTVTASLLMLISIIALAVLHKSATGTMSFDFYQLLQTPLSPTENTWIVLGLILGFGVKLPLFPLHVWAPAAYRSAHPVVAILLSGAMANAGAYGILVFVLPLLPEQALLAHMGMGLGVAGTLICALLAFRQNTMREVIAYSSLSHMNLVALALFAGHTLAIKGAVLQLLAHGISIAGLFAIVHMLSTRHCLHPLDKMGGLFKPLPVLGGLFLFFVIASVGMPGLGNFSAEILIFAGSFKVSVFWTALATLSILLGLMYFLKLYENTMLGPLSEHFTTRTISDLCTREFWVLTALMLASIALGVYPSPFLNMISLHTALPHSALGLL